MTDDTAPQVEPQAAPPINTDESRTPREVRLERAAGVLRWGAVIQGGLALLLVLLGIVGGIQGAAGLFAGVRSVLLFNAPGPDDAALLLTIILLLSTGTGLLVLMVGVLAQESWTLLLSLVFILVGVVLLVGLGFTPIMLGFGALAWAGWVLIPDLRALRTNPVMQKELRERMRGARAFAVITVYLTLMSAFTVLTFLINAPLNIGVGSAVTGDLGRTLFAGVVGLELVLIIFITPAFTAGAITGERERQTFDLLQITLLPRPSFVVGKLESALGYILLLVLAALPLQSIAFLFGGVTEVELVGSFLILTVTAVTMGTVGLYFSARNERTITASVRSYTLALAMLLGVPLLGGFFILVFGQAAAGVSTGISDWSPVVEAGVIYLGLILTSLNPFSTALSAQSLGATGELGFIQGTLSSTGGTIPLVSPWISFTVIYLTAAAVLIVLSIRRVRKLEL